MNSSHFARHPLLALLLAATLALASAGLVAGGLAIANAWGWGTNVGWLNLGPAGGGVTVCADHLEGYAWGENIGWVRLGTFTGCGPHTYANTNNTNYGVNKDGAGNLSGFAWGTNVGWINFDPTDGGVTVDPSTGRLSGFAWGENAGWIRFDPAYGQGVAPPTAAQVVLFTVRPARGGNLVRWQTATEVRLAGFHVHRGPGPDGPWARVNDALVPATGSAGGGGRYELLDDAATADIRYYQLEVVNNGAPGTFVGPVVVDRGTHTLFLPRVDAAARVGSMD